MKVARGFYFGDLYQRIGMRGRRYQGLHLVWDAPSRIVVIAYCWDMEAVRRTRDDLLHFHATLPQLQVHKKLHLVVFHAATEHAGEQSWPAGISFSPIAVDPAAHLEAPPEFVAAKLDSILGIPAGAIEKSEVVAFGSRSPNWRLFLQDDRDIVMQKIKELAKAAELPADFQGIVDTLLTLAETDAPDLPGQVHQVLNRLWEVPADAASRTNS